MRAYPAVESLTRKIYLIRGHKVMIDSDLALLYGVESFNLNKAVKRNINRFPVDFMFRLTDDEYRSLIFQIGISKKGRGGRRHFPYVFTEQGVAMLSSVLKSNKAVEMNVIIMRAFVKLREMLASSEEFSRKLYFLEKRLQSQGSRLKKHGREIKIIFSAIRQLMDPGRRMGFLSGN